MIRSCLILLLLSVTAAYGIPEGYPVSSLAFRYSGEAADLPNLAALSGEKIDLSGGNLITTPEEKQKNHSMRLGKIGGENPTPLYSSGALVSIATQILSFYEKQGYMGIFVAVDPKQIDSKGRDLREKGDHELTYVITAYRVANVNTVTMGPDVPSGGGLNDPRLQTILDHSPIQAGAGVEVSSVLRRDLLDEYIYYLNRYPGRRVDILLTGSEHPEQVNLDYVVTEEKPWKIYANVLNSGTRKDHRWMERFGFIHHQLFDRDIILAIDYATTNFSNFHFLRGYLEGPCETFEKLRWFGEVTWSDFTSSEFGIFDVEFAGCQLGGTAGVKVLLWQHNDFFVDFLGSLNWRHIKSNNKLLGVKGSSHFLLPRVALAAERSRVDSTIAAHLTLETNLGGLVSDSTDLASLGRADPEKGWWVLKGTVLFSKYLDASPDPREQHHEISASGEFQYAFGHRLIPQMERGIGGYDTVRGYAQGIVSAPNAVLGRGEYRYHHYLPDQEIHAIGRAFIDGGRTMFTNRMGTETDETIAGTGLGVEVEWRRNVRFRAEGGLALNSVTAPAVSAGDGFGHISVTVIY